MASSFGAPYITLFDEQTQEDAGATVDFVSAVFRTDENASSVSRPGLFVYGTLDGGSAVIQMLKPSILLEDADQSVNSTDFQDTDDALNVPSYNPIDFIRGYQRIKITGLGAAANFTAQLLKNYV